ncbi:SGNH/GDSL hydrolase family protein, partial [bacterium]|nr:SGNH/GDSL hydrolase family protein [bacterium]
MMKKSKPTKNKSQLTIWKRLLFMGIIMLITFGGLETILRLTGYSFTTCNYQMLEGEVIEYHWSTRGLIRDPRIPWSWIPDPGSTAIQPARNDFKYNKHGFRGPIISKDKPEDIIRVVCMGDSCTLGWGSPDDKTYPDFLRMNLKSISPGNFQVINAGVSGYSTFQGIQDFHHRILNWNPDIIVVSYNWNDHGDAPDRIGGTSVYIPRISRQFPDRDMPESQTTFETKRILQKSRIVQLTTRVIWMIQGRNPDQPEIAINSKGQITQQSSFPPGTGLRRVEPEDFKLNLEEFRRLTSEHESDLIFLTQAANPI